MKNKKKWLLIGGVILLVGGVWNISYDKAKIIDENTVRVQNLEITDEITQEGNLLHINSKIENIGHMRTIWEKTWTEDVFYYKASDGEKEIAFKAATGRLGIENSPIIFKDKVVYSRESGLLNQLPTFFKAPDLFTLNSKESYEDARTINLELKHSQDIYEGPLEIEINNHFFSKIYKGEVVDGVYRFKNSIVVAN